MYYNACPANHPPLLKTGGYKKQKVLEAMSVVIEGNKITDVKNGYIEPGQSGETNTRIYWRLPV